jgi:hypothetical protein
MIDNKAHTFIFILLNMGVIAGKLLTSKVKPKICYLKKTRSWGFT